MKKLIYFWRRSRFIFGGGADLFSVEVPIYFLWKCLFLYGGGTDLFLAKVCIYFLFVSINFLVEVAIIKLTILVLNY